MKRLLSTLFVALTLCCNGSVQAAPAASPTEAPPAAPSVPTPSSSPAPAAAASPTETATRFLKALQSEDYATCWSLLSRRSQTGLINTFSHTYAVPPNVAEEWLSNGDQDSVACWEIVRKTANLPTTGLVHQTQATSQTATVVFWNQTAHWALMEVNQQGWKVELLETVLPSWLAVQPYQGPAPSDDRDDVVVVGENPHTAAPLSPGVPQGEIIDPAIDIP